MMYPLVKDTISNTDIDKLSVWLKTYPQLTMGDKTLRFEQEFANWQGRKYAVFVNSGSSANLLMAASLLYSNRLKNRKVVVPALSWTTSISPFIQLGFEIIFCDTAKDNLGLNVEHLKKIVKEHDPGLILTVNVLGFENSYEEILSISKISGAILVEDSCETVGTMLNGVKMGNFGVIASFSTYYGHHFSTIEGGLLVTDDFELYELMKSVRSHGWSRDLSEKTKSDLVIRYNVSKFDNLFTFYHAGFNFRPTEIGAFLGLEQMNRLDDIIKKRSSNYLVYMEELSFMEWQPKLDSEVVSNFAFPIISEKRDAIIDRLLSRGISCRPLIAGSMRKQPYIEEILGSDYNGLDFSDKIHENGLYVPNHPYLDEKDIVFIARTIKSVFE